MKQTVLVDKDKLAMEPCCSCGWCGVNNATYEYQCLREECKYHEEYQKAVDEIIANSVFDSEEIKIYE